MARTILRDRSRELVRSVQLADRTGIVAASAPKQAGAHWDEESNDSGFATVSGQLDLAASATEVAAAGDERRLLRRVRRNLLVAAASVVLLAVGWIAGDTFDLDHGSEPRPAVAAGPVPSPVPADPVQPAPISTAPQLPMPSPPVTTVPATAKTTEPTRKQAQPAAKSSSAPDNGGARADTDADAPRHGSPTGQILDEQIQRLIAAWSWARVDSSRDLDEVQDRSVRSFGSFGH
ncbi:hypothetical protein [Amycolatopsis thermophila]|uniref:Uncharacterized protein n=1 Tax=Amycolatopsis thermophila TaxID=206084 RepID=A0ABU0ERI9_9PSEU|nr:hypothetical protein [Amycolatopsis thermophila]MDQ0377893.1 hypothetical protein [Amycolatopsis thermophila]